MLGIVVRLWNCYTVIITVLWPEAVFLGGTVQWEKKEPKGKKESDSDSALGSLPAFTKTVIVPFSVLAVYLDQKHNRWSPLEHSRDHRRDFTLQNYLPALRDTLDTLLFLQLTKIIINSITVAEIRKNNHTSIQFRER